MARRRHWWSVGLAEQVSQMTNFGAKIGGYHVDLGLTAGQLADALALVDAFVGAYNFSEQSKQTTQAVKQYRDLVWYGEAKGTPAPTAPVFVNLPNNTWTLGVVTQFFDLRELIIALPGYNEAIGEDLGLIGPIIGPALEVDIAPALKLSYSPDYTLEIGGSMQKMSGMRIEYARTGQQFAPVAFLTNLPASVRIPPQTPGQPETGHIRAIFIKKNEDTGNFSPDYPVTLSYQ